MFSSNRTQLKSTLRRQISDPPNNYKLDQTSESRGFNRKASIITADLESTLLKTRKRQSDFSRRMTTYESEADDFSSAANN